MSTYKNFLLIERAVRVWFVTGVLVVVHSATLLPSLRSAGLKWDFVQHHRLKELGDPGILLCDAFHYKPYRISQKHTLGRQPEELRWKRLRSI